LLGPIETSLESIVQQDAVGQAGEGVELRIINEQGVELAKGEIGEIVGRSGLRIGSS